MADDSLQSAERVVELAGLTQSAAVLTGAVVAALASWLGEQGWTLITSALLLGGAVGFLAGFAMACVLYRSRDGMTAVVRTGRSSLSSTIFAGLVGGISSAIVVSVVAVFLLSTPARTAVPISTAVGVIIGISFACLSSLL